MNGNKIILTKNGVAVGALVSHDVQTECELIEVAGASQGTFREFIPGRKTWVMTATCLVVSSAFFANMLQAGNTFSMKSTDSQQECNVHGRARLEEIRITAQRGNLVQGFFRFKGIDYLFARTVSNGDYNNDFNSDFLID
jgi:hypothetical protein